MFSLCKVLEPVEPLREYFPRRAKGVSIATLQALLEVQDYKVADKAFTELVAFNCFEVLSEVNIIRRKNLEK